MAEKHYLHAEGGLPDITISKGKVYINGIPENDSGFDEPKETEDNTIYDIDDMKQTEKSLAGLDVGAEWLTIVLCGIMATVTGLGLLPFGEQRYGAIGIIIFMTLAGIGVFLMITSIKPIINGIIIGSKGEVLTTEVAGYRKNLDIIIDDRPRLKLLLKVNYDNEEQIFILPTKHIKEFWEKGSLVKIRVYKGNVFINKRGD